MKMTTQHYVELANLLPMESHYRSAYQAAGLSFTRYAFDYLHNRGNDGRDATRLLYRLWAYLNDSHIETALRRILNEKDYTAGIKRS